MTNIKDKPGGRPAKKRIEKQQRVVSTKLTELQYYAIRKRAGEAGLRVSEYVRQAVVSVDRNTLLCLTAKKISPVGRNF